MSKSKTEKNYICYCCMTSTDDFYVNAKNGKRDKFCRACNVTYTLKERNHKVLMNMLDIMKDVNKKRAEGKE